MDLLKSYIWYFNTAFEKGMADISRPLKHRVICKSVEKGKIPTRCETWRFTLKMSYCYYLSRMGHYFIQGLYKEHLTFCPSGKTATHFRRKKRRFHVRQRPGLRLPPSLNRRRGPHAVPHRSERWWRWLSCILLKQHRPTQFIPLHQGKPPLSPGRLSLRSSTTQGQYCENQQLSFGDRK